MPTYIYIKPSTYSYQAGGLDIVSRGLAPTDADAIALALDGEIVARVVDGTDATREDGKTKASEAAVSIELRTTPTIATPIAVPLGDIPL